MCRTAPYRTVIECSIRQCDANGRTFTAACIYRAARQFALPVLIQLVTYLCQTRRCFVRDTQDVGVPDAE